VGCVERDGAGRRVHWRRMVKRRISRVSVGETEALIDDRFISSPIQDNGLVTAAPGEALGSP